MFLRLLSLSSLWLVALLTLLSLYAYAEPAMDPLDGAVFEGVLREVDKSSGGDDDRLVFEGGFFTSRACEDYGFFRTEYTVDHESGVVRFHATATSPSHGRMEWRGAVQDDQLKARVVWTKERWYWDIRREYAFEGLLVK
ncbi:hypothetical protein MARLIPOL_16289 [Marinobacter lipolyticus SM19]|uniref:Lipoprotein n=1 Tax=Marinobacter lipolyticus SM19 TaxID=1318628 RepID=R8AX99_9GAMM|nr:hypothetical protein [Marinobacter lipolyticus]EON90955.1 hypothetical protein MARLIPOL_16289 [Marinobacter lipolyticus SM19]